MAPSARVAATTASAVRRRPKTFEEAAMSMMPTHRPSLPRLPLAVLACLVLAVGCDRVTRHPVAGRVLVNGQPLQGKSGVVLFKPDASKGGAGLLEGGGPIDREGNYRASTKGKPGVPPGWYRVVVSVNEPNADRDVPPRGTALHPRYSSAVTTPLAVEVVADPPPGAYDLDLKR
jgi:hypothetical protein